MTSVWSPIGEVLLGLALEPRHRGVKDGGAALRRPVVEAVELVVDGGRFGALAALHLRAAVGLGEGAGEVHAVVYRRRGGLL